MKKVIWVVLVLTQIVCSAAFAGEPSSAVAPPTVVSTVPANKAVGVDPATTSIRVTFSNDMKTEKQWSWVKVSDETFPEMAGQPYFEKDKRTCVLPVKLKPGKSYSLWINSEKFTGFRDVNNQPVVPYLLVFETKK